MRIYNPRYTPYSFAGNKPIQFIDIDGMEEGFDIRFKQMQRGYLKGTVTESELKDFYKANAKGAALGVGILLTRGAILRYGPSLFMWATNPANQQLIGTAGMVGVGLMDPNPSGAPTADLPGVGDDVGRIVKASTKKLFSSIKPILERRRELAKAWGVASDYIEFSKKVFTSNLDEGTELIQSRVKGLEGTVGNYYAWSGTTPESIGIPSSQVAETLRVRVKKKTEALISFHKENTTFYKDGVTPVSGGGQQIFTSDLKNNIEILETLK
jgi:hypothetical protein